MDELFRSVHTLKGMAAAMGYGPIADTAHELEGLLEFFRKAPPNEDDIELLFGAMDVLEDLIRAAERNESLEHPEDLIGRVKARSQGDSSGGSARSAATELNQRYRNHRGSIWFQGHWGFQYYMESLGHRPFDYRGSDVSRGDIVIVPTNNTNTSRPAEGAVRLDHTVELESSRWLATMNPSVGAGFYAEIWGPLPFAVGTVTPERYHAFVVR